MRKTLRLLVACYLLFLVMLSISGMTDGVGSEIIYMLAFALPIALGLFLSKRMEANAAGAGDERLADVKIGVGLGRRELALFLPTVFPSLLGILILSYITSLILGFFGFADGTVVEGALPAAIINYAVLPAVLEELLFRYLPIRLLAPHSPRGAVLASAVFFALVHTDLFRIPYAFFAGLIFIVIDMLTGSILPSVIIHFINNFMSLMFSFYPNSKALYVIYIVALLVMSAISALLIFKMRDRYASRIKRTLERGYIEGCYDPAPLALVIPTLVLAILNLFAK